MAILPVRTIPDPLLKIPSPQLRNITPEIVTLAADMCATMRHHPHCVGLAAPQVGKSARLIVVDVSRYHKPHSNHGQIILANPCIISADGRRMGREGCLSVPEFTGNVTRAEHIIVEGIDPLFARELHLNLDGFEAVVFQHEIDHLDGILFLDRVSSIKTDVFRRKPAKNN